MCAAVCCSVLQFVAVCCSVLQCVAVCCSVLQCVAVCCSSQEAEYNLIFRLAGGTKAVRHLAVLADPPSKIQMWPQRAVACRGTSKSGGGTGNATHAIISSSQPTQVLQKKLTSSCPQGLHHQLAHCSYFSIPCFSSHHFRNFWFMSSHFFQMIFWILGRMAKFLPGKSEIWLASL